MLLRVSISVKGFFGSGKTLQGLYLRRVRLIWNESRRSIRSVYRVTGKLNFPLTSTRDRKLEVFALRRLLRVRRGVLEGENEPVSPL